MDMRGWPFQRFRRLERRRRRIDACVILGAIVIWICLPGIPSSAAAELENPDSVELISIDPLPIEALPPQQRSTAANLRGYRILGQTRITDPSVQRRLIRSFKWGARLNYVPFFMGSACFSPRHAIRVTHGQSTTDFMICFECGHVEVYRDQPKQGWKFDIIDFPESTFDEILRKADVPLAPKSH